MAAQTYNINIKGDINFEALPKLIEQLNALSAEVAALNKMTFEGMQKSMGDLIAPFIVVSLPRARGERDFVFRLYFRLTTSFNSRAHGGRDNARADEPLQIKFVSIHAPAGGATAVSQTQDADTVVSIHAPGGGATAQRCSTVFLATSVSIHAPARGATARMSPNARAQ